MSPYERILENKLRGLHTLVLLDIREEEGRYMTSQQAVRWLMDAEQRAGSGLIKDDAIICACARLGAKDEKVAAGYPDKMEALDMGAPLHTLVVPGNLHFMEAMALVMLAGAPKEIAIADAESHLPATVEMVLDLLENVQGQQLGQFQRYEPHYLVHDVEGLLELHVRRDLGQAIVGKDHGEVAHGVEPAQTFVGVTVGPALPP